MLQTPRPAGHAQAFRRQDKHITTTTTTRKGRVLPDVVAVVASASRQRELLSQGPITEAFCFALEAALFNVCFNLFVYFTLFRIVTKVKVCHIFALAFTFPPMSASYVCVCMCVIFFGCVVLVIFYRFCLGTFLYRKIKIDGYSINKRLK